jgi:hypothetical protein
VKQKVTDAVDVRTGMSWVRPTCERAMFALDRSGFEDRGGKQNENGKVISWKSSKYCSKSRSNCSFYVKLRSTHRNRTFGTLPRYCSWSRNHCKLVLSLGDYHESRSLYT